MGYCYYYGDGAEKDEQQALAWFLRAAEQGSEEACSIAASFYRDGIGTQKEPAKAFALFLGSAERGNTDVFYDVANCYYYGIGVEQSEADALNWAKKGAAEQEPACLTLLGDFYFYGKCGVGFRYKTAFDCYRPAAELGSAKAQFRVGQCCAAGLGTRLNKEAAFSWFLKSAEQDYAPAQNAVAACYWRGYGVERNIETAMEWYQKAAEQGYEPAIKFCERFKKA